MEVLFFGKLGELVGRSVALDAAPATVAELRTAVAERFPAARGELLRPSLRACVGDALVGEDFPLAGVAAVEFFPPLSGG